LSRTSDPRTALVDAMARSCYQRGYTDTAIEHLLEETGLSQGEFDRHFADKEACAVAAVDVALAAGIGIVSEAFSGDRAEGESALQTLVALLQLFADRPEIGSLAMTDSRQRLPAAAYERYTGGFAILLAMLDRLRSDAIRDFEPPPMAARAGMGGAEALIRRELARGRASSLPMLAPQLIYSALVPFLGQEEALRFSRQARQTVETEATSNEGGAV
jgi:AcrR family transcriptional regulator